MLQILLWWPPTPCDCREKYSGQIKDLWKETFFYDTVSPKDSFLSVSAVKYGNIAVLRGAIFWLWFSLIKAFGERISLPTYLPSKDNKYMKNSAVILNKIYNYFGLMF